MEEMVKSKIEMDINTLKFKDQASKRIKALKKVED